MLDLGAFQLDCPALDLQDVSLDPFYDEAWDRMQRLRRQAEELCDEYWLEHHRGRQEARRRSERPMYGCNIRCGKYKVTPYWFAYQFVDNRRLPRTQVLKPSSYKPARYDTSIFHNAPPWEAAVIRTIEARFIPLRGEAEFLSRFFAFLRANEFQALSMAGLDQAAVKQRQRDRDRRMVMFKRTRDVGASADARRHGG